MMLPGRRKKKEEKGARFKFNSNIVMEFPVPLMESKIRYTGTAEYKTQLESKNEKIKFLLIKLTFSSSSAAFR
jgi:hypothetical protein